MDLLNRQKKLWYDPEVDIDKEIKYEETVAATINKEIKFFNQQNYPNIAALSDYLKSLVFGSDAGSPAAARETDAIAEYIIGKREEWCSESEEARFFQRTIERSFEEEWGEFQRAHPLTSENEALRMLPHVSTLPPQQPAQLQMLKGSAKNSSSQGGGSISLTIWHLDITGCTTSTRSEFKFETTADEALLSTVNNISLPNNLKLKTGDTFFLFRVKGRNEYIYGQEELINFRMIRECVSKRQEINVELELKDFHLLTAPMFRPTYRSHVVPNLKHSELRNPLSKQLSVWDIKEHLHVEIAEGKLLSADFDSLKDEGFKEFSDIFFGISVEVFFGTIRCANTQITNWCTKHQYSRQTESKKVAFNSNIDFDIPLCNCPREIKLKFSLLAAFGEKINDLEKLSDAALFQLANGPPKKGDDQTRQIIVLGSGVVHLFDYAACMQRGSTAVQLVNTEAYNNAGEAKNKIMSVDVIFRDYGTPIVFPSGRLPTRLVEQGRRKTTEVNAELDSRYGEIEQLRCLKRVMNYDPLARLTDDEKVIVWKYRDVLVNRPQALPIFLRAVDWLEPYYVRETHMLVRGWSPLSPFDALELLDAQFADSVVRTQAIRFMEYISDFELRNCILQLVQVLKFEPYYYCPLSRFLLRRMLRSNYSVGHYVFWYLAAEVKNVKICEFHGLILEEFLKRTPLRRSYLRQVYVTRELLWCSLEIQRAQKKDRVDCARENLAHIRFPHHFTLPLNPTIECSTLEIEDCKVMDSKKFPLWLVFKNYLNPEDRSFVIFKTGDDLRQDLLTLQMLDLMDGIWKTHGLDLRIIPYGCISTGEGVGMIEVVLDSDTIASITKKDGGAQAAFSEQPLINYLRGFNRERTDVERCLWNFLLSVSGYTVATYVLGVGDRHNDNIMLRKDGTLFHIDFGHFLGNFKTKFGFKRETAPFIFTPMYLQVLGGPNTPIYHHFVETACFAYNIIRRYSNMFIMLFILMLSTGIPELESKEDIEWLRNVLLLGRSESDASEHYKSLINIALNNKRTLLNDYIHIMVH